MHRAEMVEVLVRHLPSSCSIHTSKRLVKYTDSGTSYTLLFADGTKATADVVIGADGIKSKIRAAMYDYTHQQECKKKANVRREECERCRKATPKWTGTIAYRYLIPAEKLRQINPNHKALEIVAPMSVSLSVIVSCKEEKRLFPSIQARRRFVISLIISSKRRN